MDGEPFLTGKFSGAPPPDRALAALAVRQHGLVTRAQLLGAGLSDPAVSKRVGAGRLHRVHRGVYALGHASLSQDGRWMAAVLAAGEGAALSHVSAALLWRSWRGREEGIDVVTPGRSGSRPGVRVHRCRHLDPRETTTHRGIAVTTVARTLVDLTDVLTKHQIANVIHEAAFRNRFSEQATRQAMERANGRPNLHLLDDALCAHGQGSAGTRSKLEDQALKRIEEAGLPEPRVNTKIEVDLHWPDQGLVVEVDGSGHSRPRTRGEDQERDRLLRGVGLRVVRLVVRSDG